MSALEIVPGDPSADQEVIELIPDDWPLMWGWGYRLPPEPEIIDAATNDHDASAQPWTRDEALAAARAALTAKERP